MNNFCKLVFKCIIFGGIIVNNSSYASYISKKIDQKEATRLAELVNGIDSGLYMEPASIGFNIKPAASDKFFEFTIIDPNAKVGMILGYVAVNSWTGDVWDWWGCERLTNRVLRKAQAVIKSRFTKIEMKQYKRLHNLKPVCLG